MDELKDKLMKLGLFGSKVKPSKGVFSGTGHRLGSSDAQPQAGGAPRPAQPSAPRCPVLNVPAPVPAKRPAVPAAASPPQQQQQPPQQQQHQAVQQPPPPQQQPPQQPPAASPLPQPSAAFPGPVAPLEGDHAPEELRLAVAQLASDPGGAAAAEVLTRLLRNILAAPRDPKFRSLRLSNPRVQAAVVHTSGGAELMLACGFEIVFEEGGAGGGVDTVSGSSSGDAAAASGGGGGLAEGYAVLEEGAELEPLRNAVQLLTPLLPAAPPSSHGSNSTASAAPPPDSSNASGGSGTAAAPQQGRPQRPARPPREWEAPRERNTQLLLPTSVERDVPDWFFQRTGAELKASFMAAVGRRERGQQLMTRATRERLRAGARGPAPAYATVKVRFPEGISLQGEFGGGEPVAAVFAWVADCLSDPLHTYELVLPSRQPLEAAAQSVREADLLPSVALLFRWTGQSAAEMAHVPALRAELLRAARPAPVSY